MKKLLILSLFAAVSMSAFATEKENIEIVKPIISLHEATIESPWGGPSGGATVEAQTSGKIQSTFYSKQECISWAKQSVSALRSLRRVLYSAVCSNMDLAPIYFDAGHFVGTIKYL